MDGRIFEAAGLIYVVRLGRRGTQDLRALVSAQDAIFDFTHLGQPDIKIIPLYAPDLCSAANY
jgi:hypothetical protein